MTWKELNQLTHGDFETFTWYDAYDYEEELDWDDTIFECIAIDMYIAALEEMEFPQDYDAEYLDNQRLIKTIKEALKC